MTTSSIEWCDETWNPTVGCSRVSAGCDNCYAVQMSARLEGMAEADTRNGAKKSRKSDYAGLTVLNNKGDRHFNGVVRCLPDRLGDPIKITGNKHIFVNSMSDLFHEQVPFDYVDQVMHTIEKCPQHEFKVLTKRPDRMQEYFQSRCHPAKNLWLGTSAEDQKAWDERVPVLVKCSAAVRFVSVEPMLGGINLRENLTDWNRLESIRYTRDGEDQSRCDRCGGDGGIEYDECYKLQPEGFPTEPNHLVSCLDCNGTGIHPWWRTRVREHRLIDQVIIGGESGPGARPCAIEWIRDAIEQCKSAGVPVFVKQIGSNPYLNGVPLEGIKGKGGDMNTWPNDIRVRQWPKGRKP